MIQGAEVGARRDEIREEAHPLPAALDQYRLVIGHVPRRREQRIPGAAPLPRR